ncbi:MAG: hypothetical protein ACK56I_24530, partial [bacterium]
MKQNQVATLRAAIKICLHIHDRIELPFAASSHQPYLPHATARDRTQLVRKQNRFAIRCSKLRFMEDTTGNIKFLFRLPDPR